MTLQKKDLNIKKFENKIREIIDDHGSIAVIGGKPTDCRFVRSCRGCAFRASDNCGLEAFDWMCEEYEESPVLDEVGK